MNEDRKHGSPVPSPDQDDAAFLERWSRLKHESRLAGTASELRHPASPAAADEADEVEPADAPVLPPLDSLTEDSDYSAFLSPRVSADVRRAALRKLFRSAKFNVCDGLDVYCRDYTKFEPLGDIVTADMRHQIERAAKLAARLAERDGAAAAAVRADAESAGEESARQLPVDGLSPAETDDDTQPA